MYLCQTNKYLTVAAESLATLDAMVGMKLMFIGVYRYLVKSSGMTEFSFYPYTGRVGIFKAFAMEVYAKVLSRVSKDI